MSQPDYEDDLVFPPQQPTINTFEELINILDVCWYERLNTTCFDCEIDNNNFISYTKENVFQIIETESLSSITFKNITPQQAYNIITALKDNLGG